MEFNLHSFFLNTPLYTPIIIASSGDKSVLSRIFFERSGIREFEGYNPISKITTTYQMATGFAPADDYFFNFGGIQLLKIKCKRTDVHFSFLIKWEPDQNKIMKIGQFPSVADFHIDEIKQYKKVLSEDKLREITKAIGLAANGVGIGSFVYLRRVFEHLIDEAYKIALSDSAITFDKFQKARMDEKIKLLSDYLPDFLVKNKGMYSILSIGIHALQEEDCLAHFDTLRVGIEIILDEKLEEFKKKEKIEAAKKKLAKIKSEIKK